MTRLTISLKDQERMALCALAAQEFRDPRAQAALIIRQELERRGLLQPELSSADAQVAMAASGQLQSPCPPSSGDDERV